MASENLLEDQKQKIIDYLCSVFSPDVIILFGSFAKGTARSDSDIDLAILTDHPGTPYELFIAAQKLAEELGRDVDLLDLKAASTVLKAQVIGHGSILFCSDENKRQWFFTRSFSEYVQLNEDRAPVLKKIRKDGRIYGD